jgi:hypothetical protein
MLIALGPIAGIACILTAWVASLRAVRAAA